MLVLRSSEDEKHQNNMPVSAKNMFVTTVRIMFFLHETRLIRIECVLLSLQLWRNYVKPDRFTWI